MGREVTFTITANPPHKERLSVTDMLQRAKLLKGNDVLFSEGDPLYIDKAQRHGNDMIIGVDALERMLTWDGANPKEVIQAFQDLKVRFLVIGREMTGRGFVELKDLISDGTITEGAYTTFVPIEGRWER